MRKSNFFSPFCLYIQCVYTVLSTGYVGRIRKETGILDNNDFDYMIKEGNLKYIFIAVPNKFGINRKAI